jgi:hypothetical protein
MCGPRTGGGSNGWAELSKALDALEDLVAAGASLLPMLTAREPAILSEAVMAAFLKPEDGLSAMPPGSAKPSGLLWWMERHTPSMRSRQASPLAG